MLNHLNVKNQRKYFRKKEGPRLEIEKFDLKLSIDRGFDFKMFKKPPHTKMNAYSYYFFQKWSILDLFLFIFVLFTSQITYSKW